MEKKKNIYINGPTNIIRLTGQINGINKVLYVMCDWHADIHVQTKCADVRSTDVDKYLVENFDEITNGDKIYDFFLEINPLDLAYKPLDYKEIYINDVRNLFMKSFHIDLNKNIVGKSNEFPNIRFHYIDIRDYLEYNLKPIMHNLEILRKNIKENPIMEDIPTLTQAITMISANIKNIYDLFTKDVKIKKSKIPTIPKNVQELSKYKNKQVFRKVLNLLIKL